jgi:Spy/CpxP family protein refolding chaperone
MKLMAAFALCAALGAQALPEGPGGKAGMPPAPGGRVHPGPMAPAPWLHMLNLTEAQDKQVQAIQEQHRPAREARRKAAMARAAALRDALEDPGASEAQIRALHAAESEARLQERLEERALLLEVNGVLTREQQAKAQRLRQIMQKEREARRELREEAGGPMGGPGMPPPMPGCGMGHGSPQ